jgi:phosphocarrier protein HPr
MKTFTYEIKDESGIHARPAGLLVKEAGKFSSDITIACAGKSANAKRLFAIMGLGIRRGETITITAEGVDEESAAGALALFCQENV